MQTSISTKYQVVIPKEIRKRIKVTPGQKLNVHLVGEQIILSPDSGVPKLNWPQDYMNKVKKLWENTNVEKYLERERDSWE